VLLSTLTAVLHVGSVCHGGTQVTTRQTIGPRHATLWWHCPYRKPVHPAFRLPQEPRAQPHLVPEHDPEQIPPEPHPQVPHRALQST
jgi:hypothetical protein